MSSRDDGFDVMDVSTGLLGDTKVRRLRRYAPDRYPVAMLAYLSTMAESWKAGRRVSVDDAWPEGVAVDTLARAALVEVGLLDAQGLIVPRTWRSWFGKARARREKSREDWRRWQQESRNRRSNVSPDSGPVSPDSGPDKSIPPARPSEPPVSPERLNETPSRSNGARESGATPALHLVQPLEDAG